VSTFTIFLRRGGNSAENDDRPELRIEITTNDEEIARRQEVLQRFLNPAQELMRPLPLQPSNASKKKFLKFSSSKLRKLKFQWRIKYGKKYEKKYG